MSSTKKLTAPAAAVPLALGHLPLVPLDVLAYLVEGLGGLGRPLLARLLPALAPHLNF